MTARAASEAAAGAPAGGRTATTAPADDLVLSRRRIYILPTRAGVLFGLGLVTMLLGSINYNSSLGYVLTFWVAALMLVSILHTYRNMAGLRLRRGRAVAVFAGDLAAFELTLVNTTRLPRHALMLRFQADPQADPQADAGTAAAAPGQEGLLRVGLAGAEHRRVSLPVRARRRGWLTLPPIMLASRYPFGLFRAWATLDTGMSVLVYPRRAGSPQLPQAGAGDSADGVLSGTGTEEYAGLRIYRPGDPLSQVHWKAAARSTELPVKEFTGALGADLVLDYDAAGGDREARLSQLALWLVEAQARGLRYGLRLSGRRLAPDQGEQHLHACLTLLALH